MLGVFCPTGLLRYQKDSGKPKAITYMHSRLYKQLLNIVQLGDTNVESYNVAMKKILETADNQDN